MSRLHDDRTVLLALRASRNLCAAAELLGVGVRGLQRRAARMRARRLDVPAARQRGA